MVKIQAYTKRKVLENRSNNGYKFIILPKKDFKEGDYVILNEKEIKRVRNNGGYLIATVPKYIKDKIVDIKKLIIFGEDK